MIMLYGAPLVYSFFFLLHSKSMVFVTEQHCAFLGLVGARLPLDISQMCPISDREMVDVSKIVDHR